MTAKKKSGGKRIQIERASTTMFVAVAIASVVVSISLIFGQFLWQQRGFNDRVIDAKTEARDTLEENLANAGQLEVGFQTLENSEVKSSLVLDALPSTYDFPALASSIESLASQSGVVLEDFSGNDEGEGEGDTAALPEPVEIPFDVTVNGPYTNIQNFVSNLNLSIRQMQIRDLQYSGTDNDMQASFEVVTFYQPAETLEITTETIE